MARMHSRKKGTSESTRPAKLEPQPWITLKSKDVEDKVVELARKGESMSKIGLVLRDAYGVPLVKILTGKSISQILQEHQITSPLPEELIFLSKKAVALRKHLEVNRKDIDSKKGLQRTESIIRRKIKYYINEGILNASFKYDPETIQVYMR